MININSLNNFVNANGKKILWVAIISYFIIINLFLIVKYNAFGYNAIDLSIYNQVFFNSTKGDLFQFSIHPHLYLGDHFEIIIILLLPFYFIFNSPLTLIILQTAVVALSAWPLYLIARSKLNNSYSLLIALAFLVNPFILNLNFFEFHILPVAIFLLLFAFYFYLKNNYWPYLIFITLSLLVREDVALVILALGILAIIEKKKIKWVLTPIILSVIWFALAYNLTGYFNQSGGYKFLSLYGWLGQTPKEILTNFLIQPWSVIKHLFSWDNIFLIIGLLLPLAGLPLLKIKYLLPGLIIILQLLLANLSSAVVLQTHYASLIIPFLFIATIFALEKIIRPNSTPPASKALIYKYKNSIIVILGAAIIYSFITFSPIFGTLVRAINDPATQDFKAVKNDLIKNIDKNDAVVSSFDFLPQLSNRTELYSLHYGFLGKQQFSTKDYQLPASVNKLAINFNDFIVYYIQSQNYDFHQAQYGSGAERINSFIEKNDFGIKKIIDDMAIYEKGFSSDIQLFEKVKTTDIEMRQANINLDGLLTFITWEKIPQPEKTSWQIIPLSFYWQAQKKLTDDYQLKLILKTEQGRIAYQKLYPLCYGLYPTSHWSTDEIVKANYWFLIPQKFRLDDYQLSFQVVSTTGYMGLNSQRSATIKTTEQKNIGPAIRIDYNTL